MQREARERHCQTYASRVLQLAKGEIGGAGITATCISLADTLKAGEPVHKSCLPCDGGGMVASRSVLNDLQLQLVPSIPPDRNSESIEGPRLRADEPRFAWRYRVTIAAFTAHIVWL